MTFIELLDIWVCLIMGISIVQYRVTIGLHNNQKVVAGKSYSKKSSFNFLSSIHKTLTETNLSSCLLKVFLIILSLNYLFDVFHDCVKFNIFYTRSFQSRSVNSLFEHHHQKEAFEKYRLIISSLLYCFIHLFFPATAKRKGKLAMSFKIFKSKSNILDRSIKMLSLLLLFMNLFLICLTVPNIINPGPLINNINILYHNVRGFVDLRGNKESPEVYISKLKEFHGTIFSQKPDVVILNETWLKKSIINTEIFPNNSYKVFRRDRSRITHPPDPSSPDKFRRQGGGVIIAIRSDLDIESADYKLSGGVAKAEILSVTLKPKSGKNVCITTLYRVGTLGVENLKEVSRHLRALFKSKKNSNHVLIGDFNLSSTRWPSGSTSCSIEREFADLFHDLNLEQLISCPTHKDGKILDLLLTNQPSIITNIDVHPLGNVCTSDHKSISFKINLKFKRLKSVKRKIYNMKKADFKSINNELGKVPWEYILDFDDINKSLEKFEDELFSICDRLIPKVTVKSSFQPPWFDSELDKLCKIKVKLLNKKKGTSDPVVKLKIDEEVKKVRNDYKTKCDKKKMDNVINDDDPALIKKQFWSFYKSTSNSTRIPETMSYGKQLRSNSKDVAHLFNSYFSDQFSHPSNYSVEIDFSNDPYFDKVFDEKAIFDLLIKINVNKAAGPDKIDSKLMKFCARGLSKPFAILFNKIFKSGKIPNKWKLANVVPVFKKGDKSSVTNYRPISLTSLPMKILEYLIKDLLMIKCGHLIKEFQHGFSIDKSCLTQLLPLIDKFAVAMNNKSRVDVIYFDFAKAFDSVNHDLILQKLKSKFGVDGLLLQFLRDYLSNRHQQIVIDGSLSGQLPVLSGVPQGSILGPLLFILFIDDICDAISDSTNLELYADDTKIWREILCEQDQIELQNDINMLFDWSSKNLMSFHPDKCKVMAITNKCLDYPLPFYEFWYHLDNVLLNYVDIEKDLGVCIDLKLSWTIQCEMAVQKATQQFNFLRRTCYFIRDNRQRRALYLILVRSLFEHCCQIWSPQNSTSMVMFEKLQKRAVKWILKEQQESYSDLVFISKQKELDILPIKYRFLFSDLVLFYRIINNDIKIELPHHISRMNPQNIKNITRSAKPISEGIDNLKYKCNIIPKIMCFQNSYFVRTVKNWNDLPFDLRSTDSLENFKTLLKEHLWLILGLKPD